MRGEEGSPAWDVDLHALRSRHALVQGIAGPLLLPRVDLHGAKRSRELKHITPAAWTRRVHHLQQDNQQGVPASRMQRLTW